MYAIGCGYLRLMVYVPVLLLRAMILEDGERGGAKVEMYVIGCAYPHLMVDVPVLLPAGYPIGSGVAEGACRHLVKDRMELTGMHWWTDTAQAMLDLRSMFVGGEWKAFNSYRVEEETRRLYPYRDEVERCWAVAA
jgi:hypothetical protein